VTDHVTDLFEQNRSHLRAVAYRMLGSRSEADDAVQEAWLKVARADTSAVENLRGWLTTVVARVCLDMLRSRRSRQEDPLEARSEQPGDANAEHELALAEGVGLALLVVLDKLDPAERLAFVLHDLFAMPFDEIAPIVGRSSEATRQLASRARRRVQGAPVRDVDLGEQRRLVDAFITALRTGDVEGMLAVLDPDVVVHVEGRELRGARNWAQGAVQFGKAMQHARSALVDGAVGLLMEPHGKLLRVLSFTFADGKIVAADIIAEPERLAALEIAALD
jgi:RNA polymerase sigma-70 factor, ECF subfamily